MEQELPLDMEIVEVAHGDPKQPHTGTLLPVTSHSHMRVWVQGLESAICNLTYYTPK